MKVTNIRTFLVCPGTGKNWLFVKVETDKGIHGWGSVIRKPTVTKLLRFTFTSLDVTLPGGAPSISNILSSWHITILLANVVPWIFIVLLVG